MILTVNILNLLVLTSLNALILKAPKSGGETTYVCSEINGFREFDIPESDVVGIYKLSFDNEVKK